MNTNEVTESNKNQNEIQLENIRYSVSDKNKELDERHNYQHTD